MKHKILLALALLAFNFSAYAQAGEKEDIIDKELSTCLEKKENQTTAGMCDCTYKALEKWDKKLNATYKTLQTKLKAKAKTNLTEAQRQWIKFKESEIKLIDATYGSADGTMWRIVRADKVLGITKDRALSLEDLLETLDQL